MLPDATAGQPRTRRVTRGCRRATRRRSKVDRLRLRPRYLDKSGSDAIACTRECRECSVQTTRKLSQVDHLNKRLLTARAPWLNKRTGRNACRESQEMFTLGAMPYLIGLVVVVPEARNGLGGRAASNAVGLGDAEIGIRGTVRCLEWHA